MIANPVNKTSSKSSSISNFCIKSKSTNSLTHAPLLSSRRILSLHVKTIPSTTEGKQQSSLTEVASIHSTAPSSPKCAQLFTEPLHTCPFLQPKPEVDSGKKRGREISLSSSPHFQPGSSGTFVTYIKPAWFEIHNENQRKNHSFLTFTFPPKSPSITYDRRKKRILSSLISLCFERIQYWKGSGLSYSTSTGDLHEHQQNQGSVLILFCF